MLGIVEARKIYNDNPEDPFVVLGGPNGKIEIRFSEDGMITAAYNIELLPPQNRWGSAEFLESVKKTLGGYNAIVQRKEELEEVIRKEAKPPIPRKTQRVVLDAREAFRNANRRR